MEIEDLRKRLEEIQNMDSIEDLTDEVLLASFPSENLREAQVGLNLEENEDWVRDIDMALGIERDKTQELSETVDYQRRGELEQEIANIRANRINTEEKLRTAWLQKQREQAKEVRSQMKEEAKQGFIKELEEIESELQTEMQDNVTKTNKQVEIKRDEIAELNAKVAEMEEERKSILAIVAENKAVLALKSESSQVYQVAKRESDNCVRRARRRANKIKEMKAQIEDLQAEIQQIEEQGKAQREILQGQFAEIDEILFIIDEVRKAERLQQEDQMWEQYRTELERKKESDDKSFQAELADQKKLEAWESIEANKEARAAIDAGYADGLNPEEPIEPEHPEETASPKPVQPIVKQKSQNAQPSSQLPKPKKPDSPEQSPKTNFKVKTVGLMVEENGTPRYYAIMSGPDGKEMTVKSQQKGGFEDIPSITGELRAELTRKGIYQPDKYYDAGLDNFLVELDEKFGRMEKCPSGKMRPMDREAYITMIGQKDMMAGKKPIPFEISYDLSNLHQMPETAEGKNRLKEIKRVARANKSKGLANYEKAPRFSVINRISDFIKDLLKKATTKRIASTEATNQPKEQLSQSERQARIREKFEKMLKLKPSQTIEKTTINNVRLTEENSIIAKEYLNKPEEMTNEEFMTTYGVEEDVANMLVNTPKEKLTINVKKFEIGALAKDIVVISGYKAIIEGSKTSADQYIKTKVKDEKMAELLKTSSVEELQAKIEELQGKQQQLKGEIQALEMEDERV